MQPAAAVASFALTVLSSAAADPAAARPADAAVLTTIKTETWPTYYRTQDADGLGAFLDPAFVNIGPDGSISTRADELEGVKAAPWTPSNFRYEIGSFVWLNNDLVIIVGKGISDRQDDDGKTCEHSYTSSNLLKRAPEAANGWQALSSHVSNVQCTPL